MKPWYHALAEAGPDRALTIEVRLEDGGGASAGDEAERGLVDAVLQSERIEVVRWAVAAGGDGWPWRVVASGASTQSLREYLE